MFGYLFCSTDDAIWFAICCGHGQVFDGIECLCEDWGVNNDNNNAHAVFGSEGAYIKVFGFMLTH